MRVLMSVLLFMLAVLPAGAADRNHGILENLAIPGYKDPDAAGGGAGTVTSVTINGGSTGLTFSGGPVTHSEPITLGGVLAKSAGGNGTATPALTMGRGLNSTGSWPNYTISQDHYEKLIDVTKYGAVGDDATDNRTAIQAAFDANPLGTIFFPRDSGVGIYRSSGNIVLTNASGKNFQGSIECNGSTIKFTNAGAASDTNANMQNGFTAYPRVNGAGGDTSGWNKDNGGAVVRGCVIDGPAHGAGFRVANSIGVRFENMGFKNQRYGQAFEGTINIQIENANYYNHCNAGIGFIHTTNPSIYAGAAPYNDSYSINNASFAWGTCAGALAFIEDEGSQSERNRTISNVSGQGANDRSGTQYGYLGRGVQPSFRSVWFENVKYPVRIVSSNTAEGGGATLLPGVTGYEPSGTFRMDAMYDSYCTGASFSGMYAANSLIAFQPDCNGTVFWGADNFVNATSTTDLKLTQGGKQVMFMGSNASDGSFDVVNSYGGLLDLPSFMNMVRDPNRPTIVSGFGTSPGILNGDTDDAFVLLIGTGGTASSGVVGFTKAVPNGRNCWCETVSRVTAGVAHCRAQPTSTTQNTFKNYDSTMTEAPWVAGDIVQVSCQGR